MRREPSNSTSCCAATDSSICSPSVRQTLRAGVESYSLKSLEPFYEFTRAIELGHAGDQRRLVDEALETGGRRRHNR